MAVPTFNRELPIVRGRMTIPGRASLHAAIGAKPHRNSSDELLALRPHDLLKLGVVPDRIEGNVDVESVMVVKSQSDGLLQQTDRFTAFTELGRDGRSRE